MALACQAVVPLVDHHIEIGPVYITENAGIAKGWWHQKILDHLGSHRVGVVALKTILDHLCLQDIQKYGTPLVDVLLLLVVLLSAGLIRKFL